MLTGSELLYEKTKMTQFDLEKNPFPSVYFDVWPYCDMDCNICYNAEAMANSVKKDKFTIDPRKGFIPKVTVDYFEDVVSRLGQNYKLDIAEHIPVNSTRGSNPQEIVLLGGEPTIHPNFLDFLKIIYKYGHNAYVSTNGKRIANDLDFCYKIKEAVGSNKNKLRFHIDISGGLDREINKKIHNEDSLDFKLRALENLEKVGLGKVTIACIVIRNFNEHVMKDMVDIAVSHKKIVREIDYKAQGLIGNYYGNEKPYKTNEWLRMIRKEKIATPEEMGTVFLSGQMHDECGGKHCCYKFKMKRDRSTIIMSWVDFLGCDYCWMRGQVATNKENPKVEYMFEHVEDNNTFGQAGQEGTYGKGRFEFKEQPLHTAITKRGLAKIDRHMV
jgi:organic radical activating enzyme|tara:strand:- start:66 stop:1223 length:1158 start_codon:yes stop_codon:yes gene_type:complete